MAYIEMKHSYKRYQMGETQIMPMMIFSLKLKRGTCYHFRCIRVLENQRF